MAKGLKYLLNEEGFMKFVPLLVKAKNQCGRFPGNMNPVTVGAWSHGSKDD